MFLNKQRHSSVSFLRTSAVHIPPPCPVCNVISLSSLLIQCVHPRSLAGWRGLWMERRASYLRTTWSTSNQEPWQNCWAFHCIHDNCWFQCCGPLLFAAEKYRVTDSAATCQHERFPELWCHTSSWSSQLTCGDAARDRRKPAEEAMWFWLPRERLTEPCLSFSTLYGVCSFCFHSHPKPNLLKKEVNEIQVVPQSMQCSQLWQGWTVAWDPGWVHCFCLQ